MDQEGQARIILWYVSVYQNTEIVIDNFVSFYSKSNSGSWYDFYQFLPFMPGACWSKIF